MDTRLDQIPVETLIPHGDPMVYLDCIDQADEHRLTASLVVRDNADFIEPAGVPSWVGLEYMGQAIAALAGLEARRNNTPVQIGFLVSCRRYAPAVSHFPAGARLTIHVEAATFNTTGLRVFTGRIDCDGREAVNANLNVYMPDDVGQFMEQSQREASN